MPRTSNESWRKSDDRMGGAAMPPCSKKLCVGVATKNGLCAAHAAGYDQFDGAGELRCTNCRKKFRKEEWYQVRDGGQFHVRPCGLLAELTEGRL